MSSTQEIMQAVKYPTIPSSPITAELHGTYLMVSIEKSQRIKMLQTLP